MNWFMSGFSLFYVSLNQITTVIFGLFYQIKILSVVYHRSFCWHDKTFARIRNNKAWYWVPVKGLLVFSWGTRTSPCSSAGSSHPLCLRALLCFQEIRLTWGSLKHPQVELSQVTSCPHFVISFLSPDPSSTLNSPQDRRNFMFFSNPLCGWFWASTDSKPAVFKTSQGTWMLLHGNLYCSGSEISQLQTSMFFRK